MVSHRAALACLLASAACSWITLAITYLAFGVLLVGVAVMEGFSAADGYTETAVCRDLGQAQLAWLTGVEQSCKYLEDRGTPAAR